jgi:hypothetical protein
MDPITAAIMLGSTALSSVGTIMGGKAAEKEAQLNAFGIETEAVLGKAQALQQSQARMRDYELATSANIAAFAASGRDVGADRSVAAFLDAQKETLGEDIKRGNNQMRIDQLGSRQSAAAERTRGKNVKSASLIQGVSTATSGLGDYSSAKQGKPQG